MHILCIVLLVRSLCGYTILQIQPAEYSLLSKLSHELYIIGEHDLHPGQASII